MLGRLRITLVSLNVSEAICQNYSLAIEYLRLYACKDRDVARRVSFTTLNLPVSGERAGLFWRIARSRPHVVAFSCAVWNMRKVLKLAVLVRRWMPWVKIVFGGQEVTNSQIDYMELCPAADVLVDGEGEETFLELVRTWLRNGRKAPLNDVTGIRWRRNGSVEINPHRPLLEDLDSIPSPYLAEAIVPRNDHHLGMMIETSRGCRFRCSFCFEGSKYRSVRMFSLERLDRELAMARRHDIRTFHILDPILGNCDPERLRGINKILKKHLKDVPDYQISVEIYAELLNPEMVEQLDAFTSYDVGLQSTNRQALKAIRRYFNEPKFVRGVRLLQQSGHKVNIYLILGIPGETYYSFWRGVRFVLDLEPTNAFFNHLLVLNGSRLRRESEDLGLKFSPQPPYTALESPGFSARELRRASILSNSLMREYNVTLAGMYQK